MSTVEMKRATLEKLQVAARDGQCRLFYFDEASFCGSPPVQRSWSPRGLGRPIVIVLDNASIHHGIDQATRDRWFIEHKALLFYLTPYSPELNLIEMVWKHFKHHWRRFATWTTETIDAELEMLLNGYGPKFQVNFS